MKILLELWTGIGPLIRSLPIARELQARGHDVQFVSHDQSAKYMRACRFKQASLDTQKVAMRKGQLVDWRCLDAAAARRGFTDINWIEDTQKVWQTFLEKEQFDLVISDFGVQSSMASKCLGLPLVTITQSCMHPGRKGGRIWYWEQNLEEEPRRESCHTINQYLSNFDVPPLSCFEDLYLSDKTLIPGIPEFDWLEDKYKSHTHFTGPIIWEGMFKPSESNQKIQEQKNKALSIFAYTGRMKDAVGKSGQIIFEALVEAARKRPSFNFVISTGGVGECKKTLTNHIPENIQIVDWLPISEAFSKSDLVIHHGGHGSCMANIIYGKPALVLPTHTERTFNAHRMQDLECGNFIDRENISGDTIVKGIELLIEDRRYAETVRSYQHLVENEYMSSASKAADIIES